MEVEAAVIMSKPDLRSESPQVKAFWAEMMARYGSERHYLDDILASFSRADGVEVLVVVDKLLTGFDEPRNAVLYIDKKLEEHTLLQAIARVNRLHDAKEHGLLIDYRGVLGKLNEAMRTYDALAAFDPDDVDLTGALVDISAEIAKLPQAHADLWAVFKDVRNKHDAQAMQQHLADEDVREAFYAALRAYVRTLAVALSAGAKTTFRRRCAADRPRRPSSACSARCWPTMPRSQPTPAPTWRQTWPSPSTTPFARAASATGSTTPTCGSR